MQRTTFLLVIFSSISVLIFQATSGHPTLLPKSWHWCPVFKSMIPCSSAVTLVTACLKQGQGRRENSWPYPGHWALWSFMSMELWITVFCGSLAVVATLEGAKDNCEQNSELSRGQSGGPLSARPTSVGWRSRHKAIFAQLCAKHSSTGIWGQTHSLKKEALLFLVCLFRLLLFLSHLLFCP